MTHAIHETVVNGYFDNNATTPLFPAARKALMESLDTHWHNPSSLYPAAGLAKRRLEESRERLAELLGIENAERIVFTSGATESNNLVVRHLAATRPEHRTLLSAVEHPSLLDPASRNLGNRLSLVPVTETGVLDLDALQEQFREKKVGLVSVMAANNETGVLQPWLETGELAREHGAWFHSDATQWIGKLDAGQLASCDWLSGSAHKFGGPKGIGFLVLPPGLHRLEGAQSGGPQEHGFRAGTENYPAVAAMIAALEYAIQRADGRDKIASDRDAFETDVLQRLPGCRICGAASPRLWNTSMLVLPEHKNLKWLTRLAEKGFFLSTGSACSSGKGNPSHVMQAMGLDFKQMGRVLRISAGWDTARSDWQALAGAFGEVHQLLQSKTRSNTISLSDINPLH